MRRYHGIIVDYSDKLAVESMEAAKNPHRPDKVHQTEERRDQMPPPPGRRVAAPENPMRRRISLCHSVETDDQDAAAATWKGTRCRSRAAAWKEGDKTEEHVEDSR